VYYSHGKIKISLVYNVITAVFIGSFNYEAALDNSNRIRTIVTYLKEVGVEESGAFNYWLSYLQLKAKYFIFKNEINKQIITRRPLFDHHKIRVIFQITKKLMNG
jgi:hypothetical protein